jgi:RNA polymerase sigma-70 factor (ECF subfamily)
MWKHIKKFDQKKKFKTWILTIARNTALDSLRQKNPRAFSTMDTEDGTFSEEIPGDEINAAELFDQKVFAGVFQDICDQLSDPHRVVLLLHFDEQLTFQEISDVLGESLNTVKSRYRRALERVKELLPNQYKK